jgi:hypothetical protein
MAHTADMATRTHRAGADQLALLTPPEFPRRFRLDDSTRRLGLSNVAAIKAQLAEQAARRTARLAPANRASAVEATSTVGVAA